MIEKQIPGIWQVIHQVLATDCLILMSNPFYAESAEDALQKYNTLAKQREAHPYFWNQVTLDSVSPVTAFYDKEIS